MYLFVLAKRDFYAAEVTQTLSLPFISWLLLQNRVVIPEGDSSPPRSRTRMETKSFHTGPLWIGKRCCGNGDRGGQWEEQISWTFWELRSCSKSFFILSHATCQKNRKKLCLWYVRDRKEQKVPQQGKVCCIHFCTAAVIARHFHGMKDQCESSKEINAL